MSSESLQRIDPANLPKELSEYLDSVETDTPRACKEQHALAAYLRRVYADEELYLNTDRLEKYLRMERYFSFNLFPWEKMLLALWLCTYRADGRPRWSTCFCMIGRGAGKDGLISFVALCMVGPYNPVPRYDVDICAMNEDQAMRPVKDITELLELPNQEAKLNRFFYHTKELVQGRRNRGVIKGRTNNPAGRDGMRSGMIVFNEVHAYENYQNISVFTTGQGKTAEPRAGIFTSNGKISDGPLDDYLSRAGRILFEAEADRGFLPFICRLPNKEAVEDPGNWSMANPSWAYLPNLREKTESEYLDWKQKPEQNPDFLPKRMGIRAGWQEISVTDYEKVLATKKPMPDLNGWRCTVGIDYAELNDWAAVNLHFRRDNERFDINHAWICAQSKTLERIQPPWQSWVEKGDCTLVREPSIHPDLLADYIAEAGRHYQIVKLAADNYRWTAIADALTKIGFDAKDRERVKLVRPSDIMMIEPIIQQCFDNGYFCWGDQPHLRWAVNNTKRVPSSRKIGSDTGNYYYAKIEPKSRKTDPWMALVASMTIEPDLGSTGRVELPPIGAIIL